MESISDLSEVYITCNPPLRPSGVEDVFRSVAETYRHKEIIELLYDPEIPWFKVIVSAAWKHHVHRHIQQVLVTILEQDTTLYDADDPSPSIGGNDVPGSVDVSLVGDSPRVLPWSCLQSEVDLDDGSYDAHRFPAAFKGFRFKALWRALERIQGWTMDTFLCRLSTLLQQPRASTDVVQIQSLIGCQLTHNLAGNLIYLGSDVSIETVGAAQRKLDNLLRLVMLAEAGHYHLIVNGSSGPSQIAYRWMSDLGLHRVTYVDRYSGTNVRDEYHGLREAATLVALLQGRDGQWIAPRWNHPSKYLNGPVEEKGFAPFRDYKPTSKNPTSIVAPFKVIAEARGPCEEAPSSGGGSRAVSEVGDARNGGGVAHAANVCQDPDARRPPTTALDAGIVAPAGCQRMTGCKPASETDREIVFFAALRDGINNVSNQFLADVLHGFQKELASSSLANIEPAQGTTNNDNLIYLGDESWAQSVAVTGPSHGSNNILPPLSELRGQDGPLDGKKVVACETGQESSLKGMDVSVAKPSENSPNKTTPLRLARERVKMLTRILQLCPGHVAIELRLGRIYLKKASSGIVDIGSGPRWLTSDSVQCLKSGYGSLPRDCIGFSPILTTSGPEADSILQARTHQQERWKLADCKAYYDFACTLMGRPKDQFVVEVDANSFATRCRGLRQDMGSLFLHCVNAAWDLRACAWRSACLDGSALHAAIAQALVASLQVGSRTKQKPWPIETTADARLGATLDGARIRHVARYRKSKHDGDGDSLLSITTMQMLNCKSRKNARISWQTAPQEGQPGLWYEASISSATAQDLLAENAGLQLGDEASWDCDRLERRGVFTSLCRSGLALVSAMDGIGSRNDNGQVPDPPGSSQQPAAKKTAPAAGRQTSSS